MTKRVGIWVDHEKAFIVTLREGREDIVRIESNLEGHVRLAGGGPTAVVPEARPAHRHTEHLRLFYRDVSERIKDATSLYVFGPGEAKGEFEKEVRKSKDLAGKIVAVETADKLTERQMVAEVRAFYAQHGNGAHKPRKGG